VKNNRARECVSWNEEYGLLIQEYRTVNVNYFSEASNGLITCVWVGVDKVWEQEKTRSEKNA
jgi:hypothetical protein